jgi:hypothetical protein
MRTGLLVICRGLCVNIFSQPQLCTFRYTQAKGLKMIDTNLDKNIMSRLQELHIKDWIKVFNDAKGIILGEKKEVLMINKVFSPSRIIRKGSIMSDLSKSPG